MQVQGRWSGMSEMAAGSAAGRSRGAELRIVTAVLALLGVLGLSACAGGAPQADGAPGAPSSVTFGTLVSLPERSTDEVRAGVTAAMVELAWSRAEPREGVFDEDYLRSVRAQVDSLRASGRSITLGLGLHATPRWVLDLPGGRYVDELGNVSDEANLVFNQPSRLAAEGYFARLADVLDLGRIDDVRLTSGGSAEVLYPPGGGYWAFDPNALGGGDRPPTLAPNPAPGRRPGDPAVDAGAAREWLRWYVSALDDVVAWQADILSGLGFRGRYQVLTPGVGVRPAELDAALRSGLPRGLAGVGAVWDVFYEQLPQRSDLVAYVSSVADGSGGDDLCEPGDAAVPLDSGEVRSWSSTRWITRIAGEHGLPVAGENPGWNQSAELNRAYTDLSDNGMLARAVKQAAACDFSAFYWAHDTQLWDGTIPFSAYATRIAAA